MTEREKLIELLNKSCEERGWLMNGAGTIADYLLANGVKPLPFKINDIVYGISRGQIIPIQIDTIQYTERGIDICGSNEEYFGYSTIHLDINNQIGIQWYKTKEEAEKALKGGEEDYGYHCFDCCYECKDYVPVVDKLVKEMTEGNNNG